MTDEQKVSTSKFRLLDPNGVAVEFFVFATTPPEEIENLKDQTNYALELLLGAGYLVANPAQAKARQEGAQVDALKEQFGIRGDNEIFHCISIDIEPMREGKSKVSFFGNGFKQPRDEWAITSLMLEPEKLQEALEPYYKFKLETFDKFGTFDVDFYVETYKSKHLNQNGNPYTNVSRGGIKVLDGASPPAIAEAPAKEESPPPPPAENKQDGIPF